MEQTDTYSQFSVKWIAKKMISKEYKIDTCTLAILLGTMAQQVSNFIQA